MVVVSLMEEHVCADASLVARGQLLACNQLY